MTKVLVVEDNAANMKLACLLLRNAGHEVICAVDAETGLTLARTDQPDLILMDIQLPGIDGLAATALLKQDPATAAIPVIALTAMAMKADEEKTRVAGCDAYIAKPLRYQELYAVIDSLLGTGAPPVASEETPMHQAPAPTPLPGMHAAVLKPPSHDEARRNGRLILVAEDNETNQKLILRQLALLGFAADVAGTGRLALARWQSGDYALLLSDLHMPEMDGRELTAAIRAQEQGSRRIPIVGMTASSDKGFGDHCQVAGMDDYLSKPLQLADLKATLETWLPAAASRLQIPDQAASQVPAAQAVDVSVLERLIGHDPDMVIDFLHNFQISAEKISLELRTACADHQALQASRQAHNLKSSARAVGALALGELCERMETAGKAGRTDTLTTLWSLFEQEFDAVNAFLDSFAGTA
ncbi:MAG: response regulator [Lysobacter sp.]